MVEGSRRSRIVDALLLGLIIIAAAWLARLVYHNYLGGHVDRIAAGAGWVGSVTEGDDGVTRAVTESGSVWAGPATLAIETSVGVEAGADPYMLGDVNGIAVDDERIYVLDGQVSVVRVYDLDGVHQADIGRAGEGPGEFPRTPAGIAIDDAGLLYVHARSKIEIFTLDGAHVDTWSLDRVRARQGAFGIAAPGGGVVLLAERIRCGERFFWRCGLAVVRIDEGVMAEPVPIPDLGYQAPDLTIERRTATSVSWSGGPPTFVPTLVWTIAPDGATLVGRADRYEFERRHRDGTKTVVARFWEPVAVADDEYDWALRQEQLRNRPREGFTQMGTYDLGQGLPRRKPAFRQLIGAHDGGTWVVRPGAGERLSGCDAAAADLAAMNASPCWRDGTIVDAFDAEGRYLGEIDLPAELGARRFVAQMFNPQPWVGRDVVVAAIEDEAGTVMVRRYRIVPPAAESR